MTDKQPEALRLADDLVKHLGGNTAHQAAAELRRLHEVNAELVEALKVLADYVDERAGDNECRPLENARAALAKAQGENNEIL